MYEIGNYSTCLHYKTEETEKVMIRLKMYTYQKYKWECSSIKAVATWHWNVRKDKDTSIWLVYVPEFELTFQSCIVKNYMVKMYSF